MPAFVRLEIFNESAAASGARVASFEPSDLASASLKQSLAGTEELRFTVSRTHDSFAQLVHSRVVRVVWSDTSYDTEWRISEIIEQSGRGDRGQVTVVCQAMYLDLARCLFADFDSAGRPVFDYSATQLTPTQWLTNVVLPAATELPLPYSVSVGTIDFTNTFDMKGEWATALEFIRALQQPGRAPGDFRFRLNGTTDYKLDILSSRGSTATTVRVQTARNLLANVKRRAVVNMGTKIYPRAKQGAAVRDISQIVWRVQTVFSGTVAYLEDPLGGTDPIAFDDQLNGLYVAPVGSTFSSQVISDSAFTNSAITVASTAGWTGGTTLVRLFRTSTSAGERLVSLSHPTRVLSPASGGYGAIARPLDMPSTVGDTNLVFTNPWMSTWSNSANPADSWGRSTVTGVTYSRESTIKRNGTYSQKIVAASNTSYSNVRVYSPTATPFTTSGLRFAAHVWVYVEAVGDALQRYVRVRVMKPDLSVSYADGDYLDPAEIVGAWTKVSVSNCDLSSATSGVVVVAEFTVNNDPNANTSLTAYVDSVGLGEADVPIEDVLYSGAIPMWQRANTLLGTISTPIAGYEVALLDLNRIDGSEWSDEPIILGGSLEVVDADLSDTTTQRCVEMDQNLLNPLDVRVVLAQPEQTLTAALAGATLGSLVAGTGANTGGAVAQPLKTTAQEYGIEDVYTKTEVVALLAGKASIGAGGQGDGFPLELGGVTYTSTGAAVSMGTGLPAATIYTVAGTQVLVLEVFGVDPSGNVGFVDYVGVATYGGGNIGAISQNDLGAPRTRTYTLSGSNVQLALGGAVGTTYNYVAAIRRAA